MTDPSFASQPAKAGETGSAERKASILQLASSLVQIPSRAHQDDPAAIVEYLESWMQARALEPHILLGTQGAKLGLYLHLDSGRPGKTLCLNACLDTCSFGDEAAWTDAPTSGVIEGEKLHGRGAADSKIAVALLCHLARELAGTFSQGTPLQSTLWQGEVYILFDADEHTGRFGGVRRFLEVIERPLDGLTIGYPGNAEIAIGARGFLRAEVVTYGIAIHSGSRHRQRSNAISKMAYLARRLEETPLPTESSPSFAFGPCVTLTEIVGGEGFSAVPDVCRAKVDVRLTPHFGEVEARRWLENVVDAADAQYASPHPTRIAWGESWPAYELANKHPLVSALQEAASGALGRSVPLHVCGPSNIGNFLAAQGIPAICGFGVDYANLHAANEYADATHLSQVFAAYRDFVFRFLSSPELSSTIASQESDQHSSC